MVSVSLPDFPQIPVTELPDDFTGEGSRVLLDVREDDEWEAGHVRGAIHIPMADIPVRYEEIDPDAELLVICHSAGRSLRVLAYLERLGLEGVCVAGGMLSWVQTGKPVEVGPSAESTG